MAVCLPPEIAERFKTSLREGKIIPEKLADMTSAERRTYFQKIVGEDAQAVNSLFESKLLLKDQKRGMVTWAKKVAGLTPKARQDLLAKIEKLDRVLDAESKAAFLEDLAGTKLGTDVSFEEAQTVVKLAKQAEEARARVPEDAPIGSKERIEYGIKYVDFQNYVRELKGEDFKLIRDAKDVKGIRDAAEFAGKSALETAGAAKSLLSALDNSFFGRQGLPVLATNPDIWAKNFIKSWKDIAGELGGRPQMDLVKADIYSRPNAINGKYDNAKIDIGLNAEEAFPSAIPGKIPVLGRLYKASETAFQAAALRMRADLADRFIAKGEEFGLNMREKADAAPIGEVINSMTGRGGLGRAEAAGRVLNVLLFSPKFLSANWNVLTGHNLGLSLPRGRGGDFARKVAAQNLAKVVVTAASMLFVADLLNPGSVEKDSRSSKFGKIKLGETYFDVTGGKAPIATLASRLAPTQHDGKWGLWFKSATTGKWTDLTEGKFGQMTALDVGENFLEGKLAPVPGLLRDILRGQNFQGDKVTPENAALNLLLPLPIQSAIQREEVQPAGSPEGVAGLLLEGLGLSATTYQKKK
jgi:hypothetical protein